MLFLMNVPSESRVTFRRRPRDARHHSQHHHRFLHAQVPQDSNRLQISGQQGMLAEINATHTIL